VITEVLQNASQRKGFFTLPDPASKGSCFIRVGKYSRKIQEVQKLIKYGVVKDYVLNLEWYCPNGEIIWTGANVLKELQNVAINLTQTYCWQ